MVEYMHTSGEEANEPMRKSPKAEHHCSKHPTITKIQHGQETPRIPKTEVQQKDSHHSESPVIQESREKQQTAKTESEVEKHKTINSPGPFKCPFCAQVWLFL